MATRWIRVWGTELVWGVASLNIANLNPGETLARVVFGMRWMGVTSTLQDFTSLMADFMAAGIVTQSSATGPTPPNALTGALDANPPLERWLWWGTMSMQPRTFGASAVDVSMWSGGLDVTTADTSKQVKANVPAGQQLKAWISWAPWNGSLWTTRGNAVGQVWASSLIES